MLINNENNNNTDFISDRQPYEPGNPCVNKQCGCKTDKYKAYAHNTTSII